MICVSEGEKELRARVAQLEDQLKVKKLEDAHEDNKVTENRGSRQDLLGYDLMEVLKKGIDLKVF